MTTAYWDRLRDHLHALQPDTYYSICIPGARQAEVAAVTAQCSEHMTYLNRRLVRARAFFNHGCAPLPEDELFFFRSFAY